MFLLAGYREPGKTLQEQLAKDKGVPNLLRRVSERVTAHMRAVWPEWKNQRVVLSQNGENIDAGIADEFNTYSLSRRSDGFKRFFTFMLQLSIQNATRDIQDNVIVIDEPDIGLHPTGIQYLREELKRISASNKVIVSSHSIFMIDREITDRHCIVTKAQEKTTVSRVDSSNVTDEEVIFKALGYSLFELLRPVNLIFEGWRDKEFFRRFIASRRGKGLLTKEQAKQLGLLHAMAASDIPRVVNVCENFNRSYFVISDSDSPSKEKQKRFHDPERWYCYDDIEGVSASTTEDFISNASIGRAIKRVASTHTPSLTIAIPDGLVHGKIEHVKKQLSEQGIAGEDLRKLMERIKGEILESVRVEDVNKQYDLVCKKLVEQLFA
ncbi:MAG: ATP-dependent nuclease [Candidatus Geothermincolia bacterium]